MEPRSRALGEIEYSETFWRLFQFSFQKDFSVVKKVYHLRRK